VGDTVVGGAADEVGARPVVGVEDSAGVEATDTPVDGGDGTTVVVINEETSIDWGSTADDVSGSWVLPRVS
jgi:hypothetical protein